jgi:hypothetical protein
LFCDKVLESILRGDIWEHWDEEGTHLVCGLLLASQGQGDEQVARSSLLSCHRSVAMDSEIT